MLTLKCIVVLLFLAVSLARAQGPLFVEKKLDLTSSFLSSRNLQDASIRFASNIDIQQILPIPFLKKTIGYIAVSRLPAAPGVDSSPDYQCELQLRSVKMRSSNTLVYLLTGNTLNFGDHTDISCDVGGGVRYAYTPQLCVSFPAVFSLYPGGAIMTAEPGIVWRGFSVGYRAVAVLSQTALLPDTESAFVFGYRLSF